MDLIPDSTVQVWERLRTGPLDRLGESVRRRIAYLLVGNGLLLAAIWLLLKDGSSFSGVLTRIGPEIAPVALAGFALTGIVFTGAVDLSIGAALALAGTVFGCLAQRDFHPVIAFLGCAVSAGGLMALNGWVIARWSFPAIILTLAALPFYRGVALILGDLLVPGFSGNISVPAEAYHTPGKEYAGLILLLGTVGAVLWECFGKTPRVWLALGNSREGCEWAGLRASGVMRSAFLAGGLFFAAAALVYVTRVQSIEPARMALGFELQVIAAVILGGTNIFGGEGSFLGTLLGALFLYLVSQVLVYAEATAYLQEAITGAIILGIIGLDCAWHRQAKLMEELA